MSKIIVSPHGGLGNVLFQVAACLYISKKLKKIPTLAIRRLCEYTTHSTSASVQFCNAALPNKCPKFYDNYFSHKALTKSKLLKQNFVFNPDLHNIKKSMFYLPDYYQFSYIAEQYKSVFHHILKSLDKKSRIPSVASNCVGLHIRRGDYFNNNNIELYGICDAKYYNSAINMLRERNSSIKVHVFSDDIDWCYKNIINVDKFYSGQSELTDLLMLSQYQTKILSNSTFSAWSGYFSPPKSVIYVPEYWKKNLKSTNIGIINSRWRPI